MIETYQGKKALLIGNGINQLDFNQSFSWGGLLDELKSNVDLDKLLIPFSQVYFFILLIR